MIAHDPSCFPQSDAIRRLSRVWRHYEHLKILMHTKDLRLRIWGSGVRNLFGRANVSNDLTGRAAGGAAERIFYYVAA